MKTFKECQEWLRDKKILNQFYRNFYTRDADWHPEFHSVEDVYNNRDEYLINCSFEWCRTPEEANGENFWYHIHLEFVKWLGR